MSALGHAGAEHDSPVSASKTISRPHSDRGRALLSKLGLNSGEHGSGVEGEAVERRVQGRTLAPDASRPPA